MFATGNYFFATLCAVEMSYLRGACGVDRWDGLSNERCGMRGRGSGVGCSVVEWVKRSTLEVVWPY